MEGKELLELAKTGIEAKKGLDLVILDLKELSIITDYFLICHGTNRIHVQAIATGVMEDLKEAGAQLLRREGFDDARWILLDYGSIVIHIFQEQEREFYDLERLWGDAPRLN